MTTRASDVRPSGRPSRGFDVREVVFTIAEARRALPYVARLMRDAVHAYVCVQDAREALLLTLQRREQDELVRRRDYAIDRLNEIIDECNAVGLAHIHIPTGRAAFHAKLAERRATLLWHIGQSLDTAWRELDGLQQVCSEQRLQGATEAPTSSRDRLQSADVETKDVSSSCELHRTAHAAS